MRIRVVMVDANANYIKRIQNIFSIKYPDDISMKAYTDAEIFKNDLDNLKTDLVIINENMDVDIAKVEEKFPVAYFIEGNAPLHLAEKPTIDKFKNVEIIYKQILSIYAESGANFNPSFSNGGSNTKLTSFISFAGGVGCSSLAAGYALYLAKNNRKVLYLNLEENGSSDYMFEGDGDFNFKDVIYAIKKKNSNLIMKLQSNIKEDKRGVSFYSSPEVSLDLMELTLEEKITIINELIMIGVYEEIILDMRFSLDKEDLDLFSRLNKIVLVTDGKEISNEKTRRGLESLKLIENRTNTQLSSKFYLMYNKFSNKISRKLENIDIPEIGGINRFDNGTNQQIIEELSKRDEFENLLGRM
ncbi:hypothetical protein ACKA04_03350 [Helcococcus kunzii]|uniref:hypothetical protein n=1 Tax=Helcococcus kunzii TaxID=40091 RepID=UPI0038A605F3